MFHVAFLYCYQSSTLDYTVMQLSGQLTLSVISNCLSILLFFLFLYSTHQVLFASIYIGTHKSGQYF